MKFGVIVCPGCKKVKGVDLSCKTTKCPRCGKVLKMDFLKIFYKTDSQEKLKQAIGIVNADLDGRLDDFKKMIQNKNNK
jgi:hypothetical protein